MNSTEDILQDMFMRDRSRQIVNAMPSVAFFALKPKGKRKSNNNSRKGLKKVVKFVTVSPPLAISIISEIIGRTGRDRLIPVSYHFQNEERRAMALGVKIMLCISYKTIKMGSCKIE